MAVAEENLVDRERSEYIGGKWIEKPLGTLEHSEIERRLVDELRRGYRHIGRAVHELTVKFGDEILIPDVAMVIRHQPIPLLCVEVRTPGQGLGTLIAKCEKYHGNGASYCWIVDSDGSAWEYHRGGKLREVAGGVLAAGEMSVDLSKIFVNEEDEW